MLISSSSLFSIPIFPFLSLLPLFYISLWGDNIYQNEKLTSTKELIEFSKNYKREMFFIGMSVYFASGVRLVNTIEHFSFRPPIPLLFLRSIFSLPKRHFFPLSQRITTGKRIQPPVDFVFNSNKFQAFRITLTITW